MKILHVVKKYPNALGGDAVGCYNLEKEQRNLGHNVTVLTSNCREVINKPDVIKFGLLDSAQNWDFISLKRIFSLVLLFFQSFGLFYKLKPDIIHSHSIDLGLIIRPACKLFGIPVIHQCRGVHFPYQQNKYYKRIIEKNILRFAGFNKIVTVDANSLDAFKKARIKNVIYMPNGADLDLFNRIKKRGKYFTFLFVGRLEKQKGLRYLIKAAYFLQKKGIRFRVKIVGDGSLKAELVDLVRKYNLQQYIIFEGSKKITDIIPYYTNSDVFVLPSIWEGFPITLVEAWAAKLAVITTKVGGISKICTNMVDSLIIDPKNSQQLADAIYLVYKDSVLRQKLGKNGRKLVTKKYVWKKIAIQFINLYQEILYKSHE